MKTTLSALASSEKYAINGGPFGSKLVSKDYVPEGVPVIRGINLPENGRFSTNGFVYVTDEKANELSANLARPGDLVFTQRGTLGQVGIVPRNTGYSRFVISQSQMKMTVDTTKASAEYLYYYFRNPETVDNIKALAISAGVPHINLDTLRKYEVCVPSVVDQAKIADVLSSYDKLIENNTRRIQVLEEIARALYREWFVEFRYPGHENVPMVETEHGVFPLGWGPTPVTQAVHINPTTKVPKEGLKPFLPMGCLSNDSMIISGVEEREGNSGSKFRNGDTLFARITPCLENGKTGFVQFLPSDEAVAFGSTEFIVLRSRTLSPTYVYLMARSNEFRDNAIKSMSGATGRQRVQEACFAKYVLAHPDKTTLSRFSSIVEPIFHLIQNLATKNESLQLSRDLLLPKLVSGEIDVSQLDIQIGDDATDAEPSAP